jgi:hypothetical protein
LHDFGVLLAGRVHARLFGEVQLAKLIKRVELVKINRQIAPTGQGTQPGVDRNALIAPAR